MSRDFRRSLSVGAVSRHLDGLARSCRAPSGSWPCRSGIARPRRRTRTPGAPCTERVASPHQSRTPAAGALAPGASCTIAVTSCPNRSCGRPMTSASTTSSCCFSASSTSSTKTFSPPVFTTRESRPRSTTWPSVVYCARSPGIDTRDAVDVGERSHGSRPRRRGSRAGRGRGARSIRSRRRRRRGTACDRRDEPARDPDEREALRLPTRRRPVSPEAITPSSDAPYPSRIVDVREQLHEPPLRLEARRCATGADDGEVGEVIRRSSAARRSSGARTHRRRWSSCSRARAPRSRGSSARRRARASSWSTTVAAMFAARRAVHCAATCMSGDVGNHTPAPATARARSVASSRSSVPPMPATKMSAWRHNTALGRPVVPPVHAM